MCSSLFSRYAARLGLALSMGLAGFNPPAALAQTNPACLPPRSGEYLLMVVNPTEDIQTQLQQVLPSSSTATVCNYLQDTVLRVDGFGNPDVANSWAQYVQSRGAQAFIARPAEAASPAAMTTPPENATTSSTTFPQPTLSASPPAATPTPAASIATAPAMTTMGAYNAQPLGTGYAVLVDYFNRPETAVELQQLLSRQVGLVAYGQRPYLLAIYTVDAAVANATLQSLSDRNYTALIIDSRRAVLLTPSVATR